MKKDFPEKVLIDTLKFGGKNCCNIFEKINYLHLNIVGKTRAITEMRSRMKNRLEELEIDIDIT